MSKSESNFSFAFTKNIFEMSVVVFIWHFLFLYPRNEIQETELIIGESWIKKKFKGCRKSKSRGLWDMMVVQELMVQPVKSGLLLKYRHMFKSQPVGLCCISSKPLSSCSKYGSGMDLEH